MVFDSFMAVGDTPPVENGLLEMVRVWAAILEPIPDERLEEYFIRAARKKGGYRLNSQDIIAEWNAQARNRRTDEQMPESMRGTWY